MNRLLVASSLFALASIANGGTPGGVDFDTDVIPVLTKAGCNAGSCHGAAAGRGEFRLSLYGSDPALDHRAIVRELEGRRVNPHAPDESLLLLKATESILHGGGVRFDTEDPGARILKDWITAGAPRLQRRHLEHFQVVPDRSVVSDVGASVELQCSAVFDDATERDVTEWTVFTAEDPASVKVDPQTGMAHVLRRGRHVVIARYLDRVVPVVLLVPLSDEPVDFQAERAENFIDTHVLETLATLRIPTSPQADDASFLRRMTLDLTGRLPTPQQVRAFLGNTAPKKRQDLIDTLLASAEFTDYWTYQLAKLLRIRSQPGDSQGALTYHTWLREQIAAGLPYDRLASQILISEGDTHLVGPANFYRTTGGPREQAEFVSELLMGCRLRCANCHNHPLDRWTQDDYHGLAAVFARVQRGRVIQESPRGEVMHPRSGEAAVPRIPGDSFLERDDDGRAALADWLTDQDNPYFAKAIVNRLWKALMGRGLVEPADDLRATNPATHPALLDALASDFVSHGFSLRHTLRLIANSAAYARSAQSSEGNRADGRFYSHALVRPLEPEVLADALSDVTGVATQYGEEPAATRAVTLFDTNIPAEELDILGRCSREESCETQSESVGGLPRTLHLFNGPLINRRISEPKSRVATMVAQGLPPREIIEEFYLRALSRPPAPAEWQFWDEQLAGVSDPAEQAELLEDFVWSLCTCREFVTNH